MVVFDNNIFLIPFYLGFPSWREDEVCKDHRLEMEKCHKVSGLLIHHQVRWWLLVARRKQSLQF